MLKLWTSGLVLLMLACGAAPKTETDRENLEQQSRVTLQMMLAKDPSLQELLDQSAGYAVFPEIGKGGFVAGGAYGRGVLYENGVPTGFVQLQQASIGAQVGAQAFSELVVFQHDFDVERLKRGTYSLGANASAVALTAGAAAATRLEGGVAIFVVPRGGVMAELSVSGQRLSFQPLGG